MIIEFYNLTQHTVQYGKKKSETYSLKEINIKLLIYAKNNISGTIYLN